MAKFYAVQAPINVRALLKTGASVSDVERVVEKNLLAHDCPPEMAKRAASEHVQREVRNIANTDVDAYNRRRAAELAKVIVNDKI